jgi:hypothetical protein
VRDIEHWKGEGFAFEKRFPGEYDLWVNRETMQRLRRYVDGREWLSDLKTGEYALVQDTPNIGLCVKTHSKECQANALRRYNAK